MIEEELGRIIKETEENELGEEIEPEAFAALKKAAIIVAYRKKYYDVFKDKFIYFPTVMATLMNYALIEEAERHYYDEEDEFPMLYSVGLRSVAAMNGVDDEGGDDEYMERLAMDVDIGEDTGPEDQVPEPKGAQTTPTQEEWPEPSESEPAIEEDWPEPVIVEEEPEPVADEEEPEPVVEGEEPKPGVEDDKPEPVIEESDQEYALLVEEENERNDEVVSDPTFEEEAPERVVTGEGVPKTDESESLSEKAKRKVMIKEELAKIIKETEENELGEEIEPEALGALKKAALKVAYRKKYYDVFKDEFIYFPTVTATLMNYALIEEAEKYYYDEDDEFPMSYSAALRSVAGMGAADNDDDADEDYMKRLAMDVDIGDHADVRETTIKDEEVQDVEEAEEEANQDGKARQGSGEWVEVGHTEKKSEEKTPEVASSLKVPEEKEIPAEAPSPTVDTTEPEPTAFEEEAHKIDEAKSDHFVVVEDEEPPKEDDGKLVELPEPPVAEEPELVSEEAPPEQDAKQEPKKV
jgi:hypothetical protein